MPPTLAQAGAGVVAAAGVASASSSAPSGSAASAGEPAPPSEPASNHLGFLTLPDGRKSKNSFKRASEVMTRVRAVAEAGMAVKLAHVRAPLPPFRVGDAVELAYAQELTEAQPMAVRGTVIGMTNRGLDSKVTLLNAVDGEYYVAAYPYATPLLRSLKVLMRDRLKTSGLRVHRAKLNYLKELDSKVYAVDASTREPEAAAAERATRLALARAGKKGGKAGERAGAAADKAADAKGKAGAAAGKTPAKGAAVKKTAK